jgi:hypothetical protein
MKTVLLICAATAVTYGTALAAGRLTTRVLRVELDRFLTFIAGSAVLSTAVFVLTACGLARRGVFWGLAAVVMGAGWFFFWRPGRRIACPTKAIHWSHQVLFWAVYLAFGWVYLSQAMAPETSPDGLTYHVGFVARYLREHHFPAITTSYLAGFPQGMEMLFLFAFAMGKHSAASMVHLLFLMSVPFGIVAWARREGFPAVGIVAALLFYAAPAVGRDGTVAYVDVAGAATAFALFACLRMWFARPDMRLLAVAGLIAGFACSIKYTLAVAVIYGAGAVVYRLWRQWKEMARSMAVFACSAALVFGPWLVKNAIVLQNPLSPFFNRLFSNPYVSPEFEADYFQRNQNLRGVSRADLPLQLTVKGELDGTVGPVYLALPLALLGLGNPAARSVLAAAAVFLVPYPNNISVRFLIPGLTFAAIALAMGAARVRGLGLLLVIIQAVSAWPALLNRYAPRAWRVEGTNWAAALRRTPEEDYLRLMVPDYEIGLEIDRRVPVGQAVLALSGSNTAYQTRELIGPFGSTVGTRLHRMLEQVEYTKFRPTSRLSLAFREQAADRLRVVLPTCGEEIGVVGEVRIWRGKKELARELSWRLRAWPNPWEVPLAFDSSPLTAWSPRQYHVEGAFLAVDFGSVRTVDRVTADLTPETAGCHIELQAASGSGPWKIIPASLTREAAPYPERFRRAMVEELEANGIHWILVDEDHPLARDLLQHFRQWGISGAVFRNGFYLWRLD